MHAVRKIGFFLNILATDRFRKGRPATTCVIFISRSKQWFSVDDINIDPFFIKIIILASKGAFGCIFWVTAYSIGDNFSFNFLSVIFSPAFPLDSSCMLYHAFFLSECKMTCSNYLRVLQLLPTSRWFRKVVKMRLVFCIDFFG